MKQAEKIISMLTNKERAEYIIESLDNDIKWYLHDLYLEPKKVLEKWLESEV